MSSVGGEAVGDVGTVGFAPALSDGGVVQVLPALPLIALRMSYGVGERRGAEAVVGNVDMGGTDFVAVVTILERGEIVCECPCWVALAGVRRGLAGELMKMRE